MPIAWDLQSPPALRTPKLHATKGRLTAEGRRRAEAARIAKPQRLSRSRGRPRDLGVAAVVCGIRAKADSRSDARRPLIPTESGRWFRSIPDSS